MNNLRIGYINPAYPVVRNILNKCRDVEYVRIRPYLAMREKIGRYFPFARPSREESYVYEGGVTWPPFLQYDLCHFFNNISICRRGKPYLTTFEDTIPRLVDPGSEIWKRCIESMQSERCRRLIAFSECALFRQRLYCQKHAVDGLDSKMSVLLPPQDLLGSAEQLARKRDRAFGQPIRFAFIGRDFWWKGGGEAVKVLNRIRTKYPVELFLVGDVDCCGCRHCDSTDRIDEMKNMIADNREWIEHYTSLPNEQVLEKLKKCDVGLLLTRGDTFGFSVLEMQACGLPCVTSDVWSLPEINGEECGWLLRVPKEEGRNARISKPGQYEEYVNSIADQFYEVCEQIVNNPLQIYDKGAAALLRIANCHDPKTFGLKLRQIYSESL